MTDPNKGTTAAAVLTLKRPGAMTKEGRAEIARWLRRCANDLVKLGDQYNATGRFIARYHVLPEEPANENDQGQTGETASG